MVIGCSRSGQSSFNDQGPEIITIGYVMHYLPNRPLSWNTCDVEISIAQSRKNGVKLARSLLVTCQ